MKDIVELIKHMTLSKRVTFALFCTSLILLAGNGVSPEYIPALPTEWKIAALGALAFSGILLLMWVAEAVWSGLSSQTRSTINSYRAKNLSQAELSVLSLLGSKGTDPLNLVILCKDQPGLTTLGLLEVLKALREKGLVNLGEGETVAWLTQSGREKAIDVMLNKIPSGDA